MKYASEVYEDLKRAYDFDNSFVELWNGKYEYK